MPVIACPRCGAKLTIRRHARGGFSVDRDQRHPQPCIEIAERLARRASTDDPSCSYASRAASRYLAARR